MKYETEINHILSAIESDGFEDCDYWNPCETPEQKAIYSHARFTSEYGWMIERVGKINAVREWLQGLALNIAFYNSDIIDLAIKSGSLPENHTEKQADKILDNYWYFMAMRLRWIWRNMGGIKI